MSPFALCVLAIVALSLLGLPISFDGARPGFRMGPPALGEHTAEIFGAAAPLLAAAKRA